MLYMTCKKKTPPQCWLIETSSRGEYNGRSSDIYRPTGVHDRPLLAMVGHHDRSVFSALG